MNTLSLNGVNKHYGAKHALIDFDYEFTDGVYGLLGPNGAGKSTLMNVITQNIPADPDGEILWNGEDIAKLQAKYRRRIGFMPQQQELYPSFTASRFVGYLAAIKGHKKGENRERGRASFRFGGAFGASRSAARRLFGRNETAHSDRPSPSRKP